MNEHPTHPGTQPAPAPSAPWLAPALILLLATLLRFLALGKLEPWLDENYSVVMALNPAGVLRGALGDTNPPLYLYLLKAWISLFGISPAAVRSLSAVLGVAQLAVLGAWMAFGLGLPRRAALWAMLLGALAPLHIYYSQEARSYTLIWLLFTLALWSFTAAAATRRRSAWLAFSFCLVLALYTHNIFIFFIPGFWLAGWVMRLDRRGWAMLAGACALAAALYFPWFYMTLKVVQSGTLGWIAENWSPKQAWALIPGSLEALATGGAFPSILRMAPPALALRFSALAWLAAVLLGLCLGVRRRSILSLSIVTLLPLLLMLAFSLLGHPLYVVGRYDTLVFPPLLALLGLGAWGLESALARVTRRGLAAVLIVLLPATVCAFVVRVKLAPFPVGEQHYPQQARGEVLRDFAKRDDLIVCLGLEGGKIAYQMLRFNVNAELVTYPLATRRHLGYFLPREVVRDEAGLMQDARAILDRFVSPGASRGRRLWIMMDNFSSPRAAPGSLEADYTKISSVLLAAIQSRGLRPWGDASFLDRTSRMGIRVYVGNGIPQSG